MALVVYCQKCWKKVHKTASTCQICGSNNFRYVIDYWPDGRWGGRKQVTLPSTTESVEQARILEQAFLEAKKRNPVQINTPKDAIVSDLFPDYLEWYKIHREPTTFRDVKLTWHASIECILGCFRVCEISSEHFSLYQQARAGQVKNRTINKELDYFAGFLKYCRREKKIPIPRIEYEKLPYNRPLPITLSPDEVVRIVKAAEAEPFYKAFFLCLYALGFRFSEVRFLKMENFDFENSVVKVRQKGGSEKMEPISGQVIEAVRDLAELWPMAPGEYLFKLRKTGKPIGDIRSAIKRICHLAGIIKHVTPHTFRHSIATHLMGAGVNASIVQRFLGHAQITTTQFYSHVSIDHLRRAQGLFSGDLSTANIDK